MAVAAGSLVTRAAAAASGTDFTASVDVCAAQTCVRVYRAQNNWSVTATGMRLRVAAAVLAQTGGFSRRCPSSAALVNGGTKSVVTSVCGRP